MSSGQEDVEDTDYHFDYYYVTYVGGGMNGATVMRQHKIFNGGENPDGMNIGAATKWLYLAFNYPVIIMSWQQISAKRKREFEEFLMTLNGAPNGGGIKKGHLTLVKE